MIKFLSKWIRDMTRVWKATKKPSREEYMTTLKVVLLGILFMGFVGFVIQMLWFSVLQHLF